MLVSVRNSNYQFDRHFEHVEIQQSISTRKKCNVNVHGWACKDIFTITCVRLIHQPMNRCSVVSDALVSESIEHV